MGTVDLLFLATLLFFAGAPHSAEATLPFACPPDSAEPNDFASQATPLTFGRTKSSVSLCSGSNDLDVDFYSVDVPADGTVQVEIDLFGKPDADSIPRVRFYQGTIGAGSTVDYMIEEKVLEDTLPLVQDFRWAVDAPALANSKLFFSVDVERRSTTGYFPIDSYAVTAYHRAGCPSNVRVNFAHGLTADDAKSFPHTYLNNARYLSEAYTLPFTGADDDDDESSVGLFCGDVNAHYWEVAPPEVMSMTDLHLSPSPADTGNHIWYTLLDVDTYEELIEPVPLDYSVSFVTATELAEMPNDSILKIFRSGSAADPTVDPPAAPYRFRMSMGVSVCWGDEDEFEPDTSLTANEIVEMPLGGPAVERFLCPARDVDYILVNPTEAGVLELKVTQYKNVYQDVDASRWRMHQLNDAGEIEVTYPVELVTDNVHRTVTPTTGEVTFLSVPVAAGTEYALETYSTSGVYEYTVEGNVWPCFTTIPATLPGSAAIGTAPDLTLSSSNVEVYGSFCADGNLEESSSTHYYRVPLPATTGSSTFIVRDMMTVPSAVTPEDTAYHRGSATGDCDSMAGCPIVTIDVVDGSETVIAGPVVNNGTMAPIVVRVLDESAVSELFIRVHVEDSASLLPSYYFFEVSQLEACSSEFSEPNDDFASALALSIPETMYSTLCPFGDEDVYKFNLEVGTLMRLSGEFDSGSPLRVGIKSEATNYGDLWLTMTEAVPLALALPAGDHYLSISASEGGPTTGPYWFEIANDQAGCGESHGPDDNVALTSGPGTFVHCVDTEGVYHDESFFLVTPESSMGTMFVQVDPLAGYGQFDVDLVRFSDGDDRSMPHPSPSLVVASLGRTMTTRTTGTPPPSSGLSAYVHDIDLDLDAYTYYVRVKASSNLSLTGPAVGSVHAPFSNYPDPGLCDASVGEDSYLDDYYNDDNIAWVPLNGEVVGSFCEAETDAFRYQPRGPGLISVTVELYTMNLDATFTIELHANLQDGLSMMQPAIRIYMGDYVSDTNEMIRTRSFLYAVDEAEVHFQLFRNNGASIPWYRVKIEEQVGGCYPNADAFASVDTAPVAWKEVQSGSLSGDDDDYYYYYYYYYYYDKKRQPGHPASSGESLQTRFELDKPEAASFCGSVGDGTIYMGLLHEPGQNVYEVDPFVTNPETPPYDYVQRSWFAATLVHRDGSPVLQDTEGGRSAGVRSVPRGNDPRGTTVYETGRAVSGTVLSGEPVSLAVTRTSPISAWLEYFLDYDPEDSPFLAPRIPHEQRAPQNHSLSGAVTLCTQDVLEPNDGSASGINGYATFDATIIDGEQLFPSGGAAASVHLPSLTLCPRYDIDNFMVDIPSTIDREFPGRVVLITLTGRENAARACTSDSDCHLQEVCSSTKYCSFTGERRDHLEGRKDFTLTPPVYIPNEPYSYYFESEMTLLAGESVTYPVWVTQSFGFRIDGAQSYRALGYDVDLQSLEEGACSMADVRAALPSGSKLLTNNLLVTRHANAWDPFVDAELDTSLTDPRTIRTDYFSNDIFDGAIEMANGLLCPEVSNEHYYVSPAEGSRTVRYTVRPHADAHASLLSVELYTDGSGPPEPLNMSGVTVPADAPAHLVDNELIGIVAIGNDGFILHVSQDEASTTPIGYTVSIDDATGLDDADCVPDRLAPNHRRVENTVHGKSISRSNPSVKVDGLNLCGRYGSTEQDGHVIMVDEYVTNLSFTVTVPEGETTPQGRIFTDPVSYSSHGFISTQPTTGTFVMKYARPGMYRFQLEGYASEYSFEVRVDGDFYGRYIAETEAQTNVSGVPATCGNGVVDEGEACDPSAETLLPGTSSCCSPSCDGPRPTGATCYDPPRELGCAARQMCDGVTTSCPAPSEVLPAGTLCAAGSECREASVCDGSSILCPQPAARVGESCITSPHLNECDNQEEGTCNFLGVCVYEPDHCTCDENTPPTICDVDNNPCTLEGCDMDAGECIALGNADEGTTCSIVKLSGVVEGTCDGAGVCVEGEPVACPDDCTSPWHGTCVAGACVCNPQMKGASCSVYAGPATVTTDDGRDFDTLSPPCEIRFDTGAFTSVAAGRGARVESACGAVAMLHLDAATAAEEGATIRVDPTAGVGVDVPGAPLHHAGAFNAGEGVVMLFAPTDVVGDDGVAALDATDAVEVMVTSVLLSGSGETVEAEAYFGVLNVHDDEDVLVPLAPARITSPRARFSGATAFPVATHALLWNNGSSSSTAYFSLKSVTVQLVKLADGRSLTEDPLALDEPVEDDGEGEGEGIAPSTDDDDDAGNGGAMAADASADAEGLGGGAVAGIVIGVLIAVALIIAATFMVATRMATGKTGGSAPASSASAGTEMNTMSEPAASTTDLTETKAEADAEADAEGDADKEKEEEKKEEV